MNIKEYISRIGKSRGFGIQSPWAYRFVTEVVGERLPYYAYEDIDKAWCTCRERRYMKLLLRIRNFVYPARLVQLDVHDGDDILSRAIDDAGVAGVVVIEGIHADKASGALWERIKNDERIGVTFDLYDIGICFLDRDIYKQHYKLNFF